ncbi:hypothetical protein MMC30_003915 [Trapelia coarctata]|nr:hypothetical protein [Trapelia coarctata]
MSSNSSHIRQPPLVKFYDPAIAAPDYQGRTLSAILAWNDRKLESSHDYIQVVFPLPEGSAYTWSVPIIDKATFDAFRARPELRARLRESFIRILSFYGFELQQSNDSPKVVRGPHFSNAARNWVRRFDHNHLRITRIIRSLRVLGLEAEAAAFYDALREVYESYKGHIGQKSMKFWTRAISRPLHLAPDLDSDESEGEDFLYDHDEKMAEADDGTSTTGKDSGNSAVEENTGSSAAERNRGP